MHPAMTDRERLAADLELLGILADPSRGPLAEFSAPAPPQHEANRHQPMPAEACRGPLSAILARVQRLRLFRPRTVRPLPERAAMPTR